MGGSAFVEPKLCGSAVIETCSTIIILCVGVYIVFTSHSPQALGPLSPSKCFAKSYFESFVWKGLLRYGE